MKILLDTGASFLTLSRKVARRLNVEPPDDAPTLTLQTANGKIQAHLGLLPRVRLGQHTLRNVSFVLCDACADRKHNVIGLLGLNILRRYLMTLDQANGQVLLTPQPSTRDRSADIRPFLQYQSLQGSTRQSFLSRRFVLKGIARNRATLGMSRLKIQVSYLRGKKIIGKRTFRLPAIRSGQQRRFTFKDSRAPRFERYRLDIAYGEWLPRNNDFDLP